MSKGQFSEKDGTHGAAARRVPLRTETVARAALALVDAGGLESLTMRRLATALGVQLPTLYRLVGDKATLLDEMADAVLAEVPGRARMDAPGWTDRVASLAWALRRTLLDQRDGARIVGGSYSDRQPTLSLAETVLAIFEEAGFPPHSAMRSCTTLFCYVLGEVLEQQGVDGVETAALAASASPRLAASTDVFFDFGGRFAFGLRILLNGMRAELDGPADS